MNLPFGLTHKPTRHYFAGGSIHFESEDGKLFYTITKTTKEYKFQYPRKQVYSKEQLDQLLRVNNADELPLLTEVVS